MFLLIFSPSSYIVRQEVDETGVCFSQMILVNRRFVDIDPLNHYWAGNLVLPAAHWATGP